MDTSKHPCNDCHADWKTCECCDVLQSELQDELNHEAYVALENGGASCYDYIARLPAYGGSYPPGEAA